MKTKRLLTLFLTVAALLSLIACGRTGPTGLWADAVYTEDKSFGKGAVTFEVEVIAEDNSVTFTVSTDQEYLGDALLEHGLIEGTEGPYGLYVDKVNGITASWDADQAWWGVSIGGVSASTGVDGIKVESGAHYELTYSK
jgi:predicted small lipoprotein YifL